MAAYDYDLGILGGGAAGLSAAAGAAQFGAKTILVEKANRLGGDCLHFGCVPSKTLIRTAGVWSLARRAREFGLPEVDLPPVSLAAVMERVRSVIDKIQEHDSPERFCRLGAAVRFGSPRFIDDHSVSVDGDRLTARSWIVATGSSPSLPPVEGLANVPYWTNETVFSQKELPGHLMVLGGGPIGVEMAQAFRRLGSRVTIVEYADQVLSPEDPDIAGIVRGRLEAEGARILTGTMALSVASHGSSVQVRLAPVKEEGDAWAIEGDALLVAGGRKANVEGLELSAAALLHYVALHILTFTFAAFLVAALSRATVTRAAFVALYGGLTMVSNVPFYSFKDINFRKSVPFWAMLLIVLGFVLIVLGSVLATRRTTAPRPSVALSRSPDLL